MIKQCQFRGVDDRGHIFCLPLLGKGLEKTAAVMQAQSRLHPRVQDFVGRTQDTEEGIFVLVNAMGAGEFWGSNINGDLFPEKALVNAPETWNNLPVEDMRAVGAAWPYGYPTFMNAYPYKHHANKDPSRAFGRVEIAVWNPQMHRVELVVYLDRALCMQFDAYDIIQRIEQGGFPDVSMGCRVPFDVCTICGNQSKTRNDYCEHAATMMNKILPDGRKVAVRNDTPRFFDISFVFIGADKTAKVMAKLAHKGGQVCMGEYCTIPRPSADVGARYSFDALPRFVKEARVQNTAGMTSEEANKAYIDKLWLGLEDRKPGSWAKSFPDAPPLAKEANGDMLQYFQDHPDKLKEKQKRDAAKGKEKTANLKRRIASGAAGAFIGANASAIANHAVGSDKETKRKDVAKDAIVGGITGAAFPFTKRANDPIKELYKVDGLDIAIEWPKGDTRKYKDGFSQKMKADYGYIQGTQDNDGEELDVYVGDNKQSTKVFVLKQLKDNGKFDEHKVMLGYDSEEAAKKAYVAHMPAKKMGDIEEMTLAEFKKNNLKDAQELAKKAGVACSCDCVGDDCLGSLEKLAEAIFPGAKAKSASHRKIGELIKSVPAGPFTKETLPRLEQSEQDIPPDVLDSMADSGPAAAASTAGMMGIVLKPREFQRIMLLGMGDRGLADDLDAKNMTFGPTQEVDESIPVDQGLSDPRLQELLRSIFPERTIASPALQRRAQEAKRPAGMPQSSPARPEGPVMQKLAAAYNGYRRNLIKKAAQVERALTLDPQLRSDLFGGSMVQAFAGGVEKTGFASVLGPDSLAYLVGAFHEDRGFHTADPGIVAPLAQVGGFAEMSV